MAKFGKKDKRYSSAVLLSPSSANLLVATDSKNSEARFLSFSDLKKIKPLYKVAFGFRYSSN
jgi:hypothetical protein